LRGYSVELGDSQPVDCQTLHCLETKDLAEELKTLKRIHAKKDKLILTMENEKDDLPIKALEGDKRFLQVQQLVLIFHVQNNGSMNFSSTLLCKHITPGFSQILKIA